MPSILAARLLRLVGLFRGTFVIRTGGDFLWESYVERTGDLVLLRDFYASRAFAADGFLNPYKSMLSAKERIVFTLTKWTLRASDKIVFSTEWQRDMFVPAYGLDAARTAIVENFYGPKAAPMPEESASGTPDSRPASGGKKIFISGTRAIKFKNAARLRSAIALAQEQDPSIELDDSTCGHDAFLEKTRSAWAVALVSLGDISPNMILDAIGVGTPFVLTQENGLMPRLGGIGLFVDPENIEDIARGILTMAEPFQHALYQKKVALFDFTHSWTQIAEELLKLRA